MRGLAVMGAVAVLLSGPAFAGLIDPNLEAILEQTPPGESVSALVYLVDQVDTDAITEQMDAERATLQRRHEVVVRALQERAQATQGQLVAELAARMTDGSVSCFEAFWVGNIIRVDATPAAIRALAARPDIEQVYLNYEIELIEPVAVGPVTQSGGRSVENGVQAVRAPEVWAMGITGEGVLVANMDTGVDGNHPALASRWAFVADPAHYAGHPEWAWLDPYYGQNNFPYDEHGHGTHTMGTVCGSAGSNEIGVAPGALWMASAPIDRGGGIPTTVADAIVSFEWMVDPDGNPATNWDVPAVCSNSWGLTTSHGYPPCDETFWSYLDACEAAGTVILFSAGNEGSSGLRRPADRATDDYRTCAVAAVDAHNPSWPIASFSSRGPTNCTPSGGTAIKPDIAAPGVDVRSSYPGGGYATMSGTSMASPHVNGVVALMRQANPDLSVEAIKQIIYETAYDLGTAGEDNSYGWGMIDAYEAVQLALSTVSLTFSFPNGRPELIDPNGGTTIRVVVSGTALTPQPGTGMLYYSSNGSGYTAVAMDQIEPNVYDAVFPGFDCGATVNYYFSAETTDGQTAYSPFSAPDVAYSGQAYTGATTHYEDDFQTNQGWTVYSGALTGNWERADPQEVNYLGMITQPGDDHTPDGTLCYVTGPLAGTGAGDYDVDEGPTHLTSPALDLEGIDAIVCYWRWYHISTQLDDELVVAVSNDDGNNWVTVETIDGRQTWTEAQWHVGDYVTPTAHVRVRFTADDSPNNSLVEALIDDFKIISMYCDPAFMLGDLNCDGLVNAFDVDPFVLALADPVGYAAAYPDCNIMAADINGDGEINAFDIDPFVELLVGP